MSEHVEVLQKFYKANFGLMYEKERKALSDAIAAMENIDRHMYIEGYKSGASGYIGSESDESELIEAANQSADMRGLAQPQRQGVRWIKEWQGSGPERGYHIREHVRLHNNRFVAYLGDMVSGEAVEAIVAAHNDTQQPASAAVEVSGYIATVPDNCDRIIWKGSYYTLPIAAAPEVSNA